ncbi:MAG: hypothetical protein NW200_09190 [Hyphomonadaceae bacterium]|nr:hypothetical protein [Hyphomonadaceae bacterium]
MMRVLLTSPLAPMACTGLAHSQTPSSCHVSGDSSADSGAFGPQARPITIGDMWAERFGRLTGRWSALARAIEMAPDGRRRGRISFVQAF